MTATEKFISIHAPREGSDRFAGEGEGGVGFISIHAPREGSDTPAKGTRAKEP